MEHTTPEKRLATLSVRPAVTDEIKEVDTLRAEFALRGHCLFVIKRQDGSRFFEVRRWGMSKTCSTLHDLRGFLAQIGGAQ